MTDPPQKASSTIPAWLFHWSNHCPFLRETGSIY